MTETAEWSLGIVKQQLVAMGAELFEIGIHRLAAMPSQPTMKLRVWDASTVLQSLPWLRYQNREGGNIYIRPKNKHNLSLIDDLKEETLAALKRFGFNPALVVETSPGNFQAWLKHPVVLEKVLSTAMARALAEKFGGDRGAADWRHFGRLAAFTNRKHVHFDERTGLYPFVRLIEAAGVVYPEADRFLAEVRSDLDQRIAERERLRKSAEVSVRHSTDLKHIEAFRADARYGGDSTRADLAYAVYALSRGISATDVERAIRSRDLAHKGTQLRQNQYVDRTIRKAMTLSGRGR